MSEDWRYAHTRLECGHRMDELRTMCGTCTARARRWARAWKALARRQRSDIAWHIDTSRALADCAAHDGNRADAAESALREACELIDEIARDGDLCGICLHLIDTCDQSGRCMGTDARAALARHGGKVSP